MAPPEAAAGDERQTGVTAAGDQVGVIPDVRGGQASDDPDSGIVERATSSPGRRRRGRPRVPPGQVEAVTTGEGRLSPER